MKEFCKNDSNYIFHLCWDCELEICPNPDCQWKTFKKTTNPKFSGNIKANNINELKGFKYDNKY